MRDKLKDLDVYDVKVQKKLKQQSPEQFDEEEYYKESKKIAAERAAREKIE